MDVIITAFGEFIWISFCAIVDFCLSSGLSALVVFVSFLCGILASAYYKYTISRELLLFNDRRSTLVDNNDDNKPVTTILSTMQSAMRSPSLLVETTNTNNTNSINPLSEIEILNDQTTSENEENNEQIYNNMAIYTTEDSEEEVRTNQIKNIYHLLNDNHLTDADFLDQLKMYGLQIDDETELKWS